MWTHLHPFGVQGQTLTGSQGSGRAGSTYAGFPAGWAPGGMVGRVEHSANLHEGSVAGPVTSQEQASPGCGGHLGEKGFFHVFVPSVPKHLCDTMRASSP